MIDLVKSQPLKHWDITLSSLNVAINAMNAMKDVVDGVPLKAPFASFSIIFTVIKMSLLLIYLSQLHV